jgi:hypothetical protein
MNKRIAKKIDKDRIHWQTGDSVYSKEQRRRAERICDRGGAMKATLWLVNKLDRIREEVVARGERTPSDQEIEALILGWRERVRPKIWKRVKSEYWKTCSWDGQPFATKGWGVQVATQRREENAAAFAHGDAYSCDLFDHIVADLSYYSDRWCGWRVERIDDDIRALEAGEGW